MKNVMENATTTNTTSFNDFRQFEIKTKAQAEVKGGTTEIVIEDLVEG